MHQGYKLISVPASVVGSLNPGIAKLKGFSGLTRDIDGWNLPLPVDIVVVVGITGDFCCNAISFRTAVTS